MIIKYINTRGELILSRGSSSPLHVTHITGLGLAERDYSVVSYAGYDGQETLSSHALARCITISGDVISSNAASELRHAVDILEAPGYLYLSDSSIDRRIYVNQTVFPDADRILSGRIAAFALQLICDNPFFEDSQDTSLPLYSRSKDLTTPFTLPHTFGTTVSGADIKLQSRNTCEPKIHIVCPTTLTSKTSIVINNLLTGKKIELSYAPVSGEKIIIDIKERCVTSSINGNIINCISNDTYLSEFILEPGTNPLAISIGNVSAGIIIECVYNNRYSEALLI